MKCCTIHHGSVLQVPPRHRSRPKIPPLVILTSAVLLVGVVGIALAVPTSSTAPITTTTPPTTTSIVPTTTTTVDVGLLPQTSTQPRATDPAFQAKMASVLSAIQQGNPELSHSSFFPLNAYLQTKSGGGNDTDWHLRLLANWDRDVRLLHARLSPSGSPLLFAGATVVGQSSWITPGLEQNKGPYWRTLGAVIAYRTSPGGPLLHQSVLCCISWRGQWYPIHLLSFT